MKKIMLFLVVLLSVVGLSSKVMAIPLPNGTLLTINRGVQPGGPGSVVTSNSWFGMDAYSTGDPAQYVPTLMGPGLDGGIIVGQTQLVPAQNNPGGPISVGGITAVWSFFGGGGINGIGNPAANSWDFDTGAITIGSWDIHWGGNIIPMGGGIVTNSQQIGNNYTLDYLATVPSTVPQWGNVGYSLHLEGQIIPEPASLLLIGTGLAGLFGVMRKKG